MIIRDEEVNLRQNLPVWSTIADFFVFLIDNRTRDSSEHTIRSILRAADRPFFIQEYFFEGFGQARTLSLSKAFEHFPQASHVLIADPDWKPDTTTINKHDLDDSADVFRFVVFDRNGFTRRRMDWLLRMRSGLAMRYHVHEVLDIGQYSVKSIPWIIHEIEQAGTWHTTVGHSSSFAAKRFLFDLDLLYKDLTLYGHDPHTHYYLGSTLHAYVESHFKETGHLNTTMLDSAIEFLEKRVRSVYADEFVEERWACLYTLGSIYSSLRKEYIKAVYWLSMCRDYNEKQIDCGIALTTLYFNYGVLDSAQSELDAMLKQPFQERLMLNTLNIYDCKLPEVALHIFQLLARARQLTVPHAKYTLLLVTLYITRRRLKRL